ncbi:MAG: sodium:proton antiporter [Phycisphaerales bacterium]|nr:sodium:proton antiporter [Phycisphaerales bacterium]
MFSEILAFAGPHGLVSETVQLTMMLLVIAASVAIATRLIRIPYTVALVIAGLVIALLHLAPRNAILSQELVLILFLPPLLFQAGLHLDIRLLRRGWLPVALMALPGVLVTMGMVGAGAYFFLPDHLRNGHTLIPIALLFGAILATTDPISVLAVFKSAGAPERLKTLVEGESLFNDGTGIVLFILLIALVFPQGVLSHTDDAELTPEVAASVVQQADPAHELAHDHAQPTQPTASTPRIVAGAVFDFVRVVGLGTLLGLLLGVGGMVLLRFINDHTLETAITIVLVWGGFLLAENIHASGVFTVVIIGLVTGNYGRFLSMSEETRITVEGFWDAVDFVINSLVFLLIGTELQEIGTGTLLDVDHVIVPAAVTLGVLLVSRAILVYSTGLFCRRKWERGWNHVIFWAGLKGSIPLALVLGMPDGPVRKFFLPVIFVVVLFSLVVQGTTMPHLIRILGVGGRDVGEP